MRCRCKQRQTIGNGRQAFYSFLQLQGYLPTCPGMGVVRLNQHSRSTLLLQGLYQNRLLNVPTGENVFRDEDPRSWFAFSETLPADVLQSGAVHYMVQGHSSLCCSSVGSAEFCCHNYSYFFQHQCICSNSQWNPSCNVHVCAALLLFKKITFALVVSFP